MGEITSIDVPELTRIGDGVLDVAGRLGRLAGGIETWEHTADEAVDGSQVCRWALPATSLSWRYTLEKLAGDLRSYGDDLRQAAAGYRAADVAAQERVRASGHPAFRPGGAAGF